MPLVSKPALRMMSKGHSRPLRISARFNGSVKVTSTEAEASGVVLLLETALTGTGPAESATGKGVNPKPGMSGKEPRASVGKAVPRVKG
jgi:hypothetical protein